MQIFYANDFMKTRIYLIISFLVFLVSCGESLEERIIYSHPNNTPALVEYTVSGDTTKQVVKTVRYYFNGERQEELHLKDGKKHGVCTMWYMNGEKMFEATYDNDVLHGTFVQWYDNGEKDYEAQYNQGKAVGTWKYYNRDGSLMKETPMSN